MEFVLDVHTHSLASGHAYSTIQEMAKEAAKNGLELLGISEHAPAMPGTCNEMYFHNLKAIPDEIDGVEMLFGIEANIIDFEGGVDTTPRTFDYLDYALASFHPGILTPGSSIENTQTYLKVMENPYINIIGHPDDSRVPVDYKELVAQAKATKTLLEVNNSSLSPISFRSNVRANYKTMLTLCAEQGVPIIVNSDAHISFAVGDLAYAIDLLEEIDFPEELIANESVERFKYWISLKKNF